MTIAISKKSVNVSPEAYAAAAVLAAEVGQQLLARLDWVVLQPNVIADVGCGVGHCAGKLQERYREATVVAVDIAHPMLQYAKQQVVSTPDTPIQWICAAAERLPFLDHSVDLLFANLMLPWCDNVENVLREWRRVLRPDGLLMFTGLGPDTLRVFREVFANIVLPDVLDMHEVGDALTRAKWADPVLDVDYFTLTYRSMTDLVHELGASGMIQVDQDQYQALIHGSLVQSMPDGRWSTPYEVIFGHAWGPHPLVDQVADEFGTVKIPLSQLRRRQ